MAAQHRLDRSPDGLPGRPNYMWFPPGWFTVDKLNDLATKHDSVRIPVLVPPALASLTRQFASFQIAYNEAGPSPVVTFSPQAVEVVADADPIWTSGLYPGPVQLSPEERQEATEKRFASLHALHIPGTTEGRSSNVLYFAGAEGGAHRCAVRLLRRPLSSRCSRPKTDLCSAESYQPEATELTRIITPREDMDRVLSPDPNGVPNRAQGNSCDKIRRGKPRSSPHLNSPPLCYLEQGQAAQPP